LAPKCVVDSRPVFLSLNVAIIFLLALFEGRIDTNLYSPIVY